MDIDAKGQCDFFGGGGQIVAGRRFDKSLENHERLVSEVKGILEGAGYSMASDVITCRGRRFTYFPKVQALSMFGTPRFDDLMINTGRGLFRIECHYQGRSGGTDSRVAIFLGNSKAKTDPTIHVFDGGGASDNKINWLKSEARKTKQIRGVFSVAEFQRFIDSGKPNKRREG